MRPLLTLLSLFLFTAAATAAPDSTLRGTVVDGTGRTIAGATVYLRAEGAGLSTVTDRRGEFVFERVPDGSVELVISADRFAPASVVVSERRSSLRVTMESVQVSEEITVRAPGLFPTRSSTATKTDTPLRDVPQSVTVIGRAAIEQQTMRSVADVVRYVPGVGIASGEGNRDTPVFRGNASTSDFFVDGVRDDVQYFRDLYNVERVEALKGPNAMMFGRGGVGGVLNRVTRQADWTPTREITIQGGSWNGRRVNGDFGHAFGEKAAVRLTSMMESSESYRSGVRLSRYGVNPTFALALGSRTMLRGGLERFRDERTADRGVSSYQGRPLDTDASTFFGNADDSTSDATATLGSLFVEHRFSESATLRSRIGYGDYDKFYQNVFPGAVDASGQNVSISAYNNVTLRKNVFSQTDFVLEARTGSLRHTILAGLEIGSQVTDNQRKTGYFATIGPNVTSVSAPLARPVTTLPVTFRQSATDADNHGVAKVRSLYVQDQVTITRWLQAIAGLRYDGIEVDFRNNRTGDVFRSDDTLVSPRLGLVFKPIEALSIYASSSISYLPRAGEQLSSLSLTNQALEPEKFTNYEIGAKGEIAGSIELAGAVYRLERSNVAVPHPTDPSVTSMVDGQRSEGVEMSVAGSPSKRWDVIGAYSWQDGRITQSLSSTALAGARLAQLPEHSFSLWNKVDFTSQWGAGIGVVHRGEIFTSTDNTVRVPGFTRADAAVFLTLNGRFRAQLNVENLFDTGYFAYAHSNTNITPGSPRALRLTWTTKF